MRTSLGTLVLSLALTSLAAAQTVHVVDAGGAGDFTTIQQAIDTASGGDVVLIQEGSYEGATLSGKSLSLIAAPGAAVEVQSGLFVEGLPVHTTSVFSGLTIHGADGESDPALQVEHCPGTVWVQSCELRGSHGGAGFANVGALFVDCSDVVLLRSEFTGGNATAFPKHQGRSGLAAVDSRLWAFESEFLGTHGGFHDDLGGLGGHGVLLTSSELFSAYGEFHGAVGGAADDDFDMGCGCVICGAPGEGGSGIQLHQGSHATLHRAQLFPAAGGGSISAAGCGDGPDGAALQFFGGSSSMMLGGEPRGLRVSPVVLENGSFDVTFFGAPGDFVHLIAGLDVRASYLPNKLAPLLLPLPFLIAKPFGSVPAAGFKQLQLQMPELPAGLDGLLITTQAHFSPSGQLSNGTTTLVLDESL